jgi:Type II site-specific deoxyribonuclease
MPLTPRSPGATPHERMEEARGELLRIAAALDLPRVILLQKMASAMTVPIKKLVPVDSDNATHNFEVAFSNQLLIHHATSDEPLKKKSFEYLLRTAFEADGRRAEINLQTKSWDVKADEERFSLKTEAESRMPLDSIRIQKFMDATWVRECVSAAEYASRAAEAFPAHLAHYDRILVLRVFKNPGVDAYRYQLVEVPKTILGLLGNLDPASIERTRGDKENRGYGANVEFTAPGGGSVRAFRVLFDRSVGKVRLHSIRQSLCKVHGEWTIPLRVAGGDDES